MMRQTQLVGHRVTADVLFFVLSLLLICTTVIVGVYSYSSITKLQGEQTTLQDDQTNLRQEYDTLYFQVANLSSTVSSLEVNCSALGLDYSNLQSLCANLQSQVLSLESNVGNLQIGYGSLESRVASLQSQVANLTEEINQLPSETNSSYYLFKQNDTYYVKSGLTGEIEDNDTNCSSVINYTFAHVPYGGAVFFEPLASADDAYYIDSTIYPPNGTTLASENRVVTICLSNDTNADAIDLHNVHDVQIENINITGIKGTVRLAMA